VAYDEALAARVRANLAGKRGIVEKKMFGGLAFLLDGNMSVGIYRDELIVRIAPDETDAALAEPGTRPFDITGRPMKGWLIIGGAAIARPQELAAWVARGAAFAASLPKK
jgi:TfoX/Sxy family transcriptional regulator of competence genes